MTPPGGGTHATPSLFLRQQQIAILYFQYLTNSPRVGLDDAALRLLTELLRGWTPAKFVGLARGDAQAIRNAAVASDNAIRPPNGERP